MEHPLLSAIKENKIVAILRGYGPADVGRICEALYDGGIRIVEITLNSPFALQSIGFVAERFRDHLYLGAGTVLDRKSVKNAVSAGAQFIVSPILDVDIIRATKKLGALSIPGAFSPTEIFRAAEEGADVIKVFPSAGPSFIREILAPLPDLALMPTGGIHPSNAADYLTAGALAVGVGGHLVPGKELLGDSFLQEVKSRAIRLIEAVHVHHANP